MKIQTRPQDKTGIFDLSGMTRGEALKTVNFYYDQQARAREPIRRVFYVDVGDTSNISAMKYLENLKYNNLCQEIMEVDPGVGYTGHSGEMLEAGISAPYPPLKFKTREDVSIWMHSDDFYKYEVTAPKEEVAKATNPMDWDILSELFQASMTEMKKKDFYEHQLATPFFFEDDEDRMSRIHRDLCKIPMTFIA